MGGALASLAADGLGLAVDGPEAAAESSSSSPAAPTVPEDSPRCGVAALHRAVSEGDAVEVLRLLARGGDPNKEDALLGEPPLFEAVAADSAAIVGLLLLFGADPARPGRGTSAFAVQFAPDGSTVAGMLQEWQRGDPTAAAAAVGSLLEALPGDCKAVAAAASHLDALGGGPQAACKDKEMEADADAADASADDSSEAVAQAAASHATTMGKLSSIIVCPQWSRSRLAPLERSLAFHARQQPTLVSGQSELFSTTTSVAHILWALVAACEPKTTLTEVAFASRSMAELVLGDADDSAWQLATLQVARSVVLTDRRRRGPDGRPQSWRSTLQELLTQKLFCWGVDGTVTGRGARAPSRDYSQPRGLKLEPVQSPRQAGARLVNVLGHHGHRPAFTWPPLGSRPVPARRYPSLLVSQARMPVAQSVAPAVFEGPQGAEAPSSRPQTPSTSSTGGGLAGGRLERPFCFTIACGRRHSAVATFGGAAYAWGRDVALPAPPPAEARENFDSWHAWRATQQSRVTTCDRPRRLALGRPPAPPGRAAPGEEDQEPLGHDEHDDDVGQREQQGEELGGSAPAPTSHVSGLHATPSATLLKLEDGRTVCAGGWAAHEAQLPERLAEAEETMQRRSQLPPLRKIARGFCFNVALSQDGRIFVWRHSGLFPTGATERVPRDPWTPLPPGEFAVDIAVGEGHIVALTARGQVWTFGWQQRSALGRGPRLTLNCAGTPAPVPGLEDIVQIGAGASYTVCLDSMGSVWMFGEGPCVVGAFNDPKAIYEPCCIPDSVFGGRAVLSICCGDGHILALAAWDPHRCLLQPGAWYAELGSSHNGEAGDAQDVVLGEWTP